MWPDPRSRYHKAAKVWISQLVDPRCALCGRPVDTTLSSNAPWGPTIEHTVPIRRIRTEARTWAECVAWASDSRLWSIAHRRCQSRQGARVANAIKARPKIVRHTTRQW